MEKNIKEIEYEFHRWRKPLLIIDIIISIIVIILLALIRQDYLVIGVYLLIIPYLVISERKTAFYHFLAASLVSLIWIIIAKNQYGYNQNFLTILGLNTFPLFAWAVGLFAMYLFYSYFEHFKILKGKGFIRKIILFCIFYFPILIIMETSGYYLFNIHNLTTANFPGLPICNCLHAPGWMQISYFALGPVFFAICYVLKLENPHLTKKFKNKLKHTNKHGRDSNF